MPDAHHDTSSPANQAQAPAAPPSSSPGYEGFDPDLPEARDRTGSEQPKKHVFGGLSSVQVGASALAAVTSALAASFFGVAGTLIGAAVGSMVSTVAGAMYAESMRRAADRLKDVPTVVLQKIPVNRATDPADVPPTTALTQVGKAPNDRTVVLAAGPAETSVLPSVTSSEPVEPVPATVLEPERQDGAPRSWWRRPLIVLPVVGAAGFVIAIGAVVGIELVVGHSISRGDTGRTTLSQLAGTQTQDTGDSDDAPAVTPSTESTPSVSSTTSPDASPSPTTEPSASSEPSVTSEPSRTSEPGSTADSSDQGLGSSDQQNGSGGSALGRTGSTEQPNG